MSFLIRYAPTADPGALCRISLGRGRYVIVDIEDVDELNKYRWFLKMSNCCYYAVRKKFIDGKCILIRMHREIMHTPPGQECHHIFCNTLDNRKSQLENLTPAAHREVHKTRVFLDHNPGTPTERHSKVPF